MRRAMRWRIEGQARQATSDRADDQLKKRAVADPGPAADAKIFCLPPLCSSRIGAGAAAIDGETAAEAAVGGHDRDR
jgi:hypothetical protein